MMITTITNRYKVDKRKNISIEIISSEIKTGLENKGLRSSEKLSVISFYRKYFISTSVGQHKRESLKVVRSGKIKIDELENKFEIEISVSDGYLLLIAIIIDVILLITLGSLIPSVLVAIISSVFFISCFYFIGVLIIKEWIDNFYYPLKL